MQVTAVNALAVDLSLLGSVYCAQEPEFSGGMAMPQCVRSVVSMLRRVRTAQHSCDSQIRLNKALSAEFQFSLTNCPSLRPDATFRSDLGLESSAGPIECLSKV